MLLELPGPAQQDFDWGGLNVSQLLFFFFFFGGGGGGGGGGGEVACYPWKIWVLVTLRHRKVFLKLCCLNVGSARDYCNLFALAFELALFRFVTSHR